MDNLQTIKQRFGIIGNDEKLNRALQKAVRVAPTDISVLVTGESGVGKEVIPKIIHHLSHRKHKKYIAVNCGAIPEGTIDSELFGHEKGAFTGATQTRKGYFEVADGGTIFLDEVGELPLPTQVRLLRVLETGEFLKVGSSIPQKTDVRIVAATNVNMQEAINKGKFREDLYYRLSTVEIELPPLRERKGDVHLLFRKFASDFAKKYNMPTIRLTEDAVKILQEYPFKGNIRQLRNIVEQMSVIEESRLITPEILKNYLPDNKQFLPILTSTGNANSDFGSEREIFYKIMLDMRKDINELKKITNDLMQNKQTASHTSFLANNNDSPELLSKYSEIDKSTPTTIEIVKSNSDQTFRTAGQVFTTNQNDAENIEEIEPLISLQEKEKEMIIKALERNSGKRKKAANELGISERTLYRKIKQYDLQ
ncbi:MAG TPA: sigma-54-dependent Fis family transcriptional regulator [Flavobacteriia bacterium]|nr:sigma-54-dependent Fis family transcriptional regulator [Flavobacteriia bacterium]